MNLVRFELTTSAFAGLRSNPLSYRFKWAESHGPPFVEGQNGATGGNRTHSLVLTKDVHHRCVTVANLELTRGLEPPTFCLRSSCTAIVLRQRNLY